MEAAAVGFLRRSSHSLDLYYAIACGRQARADYIIVYVIPALIKPVLFVIGH